MIFVTVCLISIILLLIYLFFKWKYMYWKNAGVLHIKPQIPFGNLKSLGDSLSLVNVVEELYYTCKKNKDSFGGLYILASPRAVISDLELIKSILIKDFNYFHDRGLYHDEEIDPLSGQLFLLEGQKWRELRNKLSPTFSSGKMKFMFPTVVKVGEELRQTLEEMIETKNQVEMKDLIARFTTDVIGSCAFGIECNSLKDPKTEFRTYGRKVIEEPVGGELGFVLRTAFQGIAKMLKLKNFTDEIEKFFTGIVENTLKYREENKVRRNDFLDILIQLKNSGDIDSSGHGLQALTLKETVAQAFVFFLAGFETSSTTMAFCLYELALNQTVQEKARNEVRQVLAKHGGEITYEAIMDCKYLDQIINETLRKYPILPMLVRSTTADYKVPNTDKTIEKGTAIFIPVDAIQHDPEYFPNPYDFDPDRFSPELVRERNPMTFLPFGDGPRNCIGMRFGQMQARIGLVYLLQNFKFTNIPSKPLKIKFSALIYQIETGVHLNVTKVEKSL